MGKNAVVAQSGGPTCVLNNSICGAVDVLMHSGEIDKVYGADMGILGVLRDRLIDISSQDREQIRLLERTPAAGTIGSCRYRLADRASGKSYGEDYARIIEVFKAHNVGYFFYAGGNDSMDTASRISKLAAERESGLQTVGIVKTIDNDVGGNLQEDGTFGICDHNPGYGSAARFWAINVLEANEENKASYTSEPVLVMQAMGRKIGFITAAARLADPKRNMPLLIMMPEALSADDSRANLEFITQNVNDLLKEAGRCMIVITEGANLGDVGVLRDGFGHAQFSASERTAGQLLINHLNGIDRKDSRGKARSRLCVLGIARLDTPGTIQRRDIGSVSSTDLREAYEVGANAASLALEGHMDFMSTLLRVPGPQYSVRYDKVALDLVANAERKFPAQWIAPSKVDVTDGYVRWAAPLIGEPLPRFACFQPKLAEKSGLKDYVPQGFRG